jgi:hypothetical protein
MLMVQSIVADAMVPSSPGVTEYVHGQVVLPASSCASMVATTSASVPSMVYV